MDRRHDERARGRDVLLARDLHPEQRRGTRSSTMPRREPVEDHAPARTVGGTLLDDLARQIVDDLPAARGGVDARSRRRRRPRAVTRPRVPSARRAGRATSRTASTSTVALRGRLVALTAGGPLLVAGGEEHLQRRRRGTPRVPMSRPSTTPPPCSLDPGPLPGHEHGPHRRDGRDLRHRAGDLGTADLGRRRRRRRARHDVVLDLDGRRRSRHRRRPPRRRRVDAGAQHGAARPPGTSRRCRAWRPSAAATPRATVDFPDPTARRCATTFTVMRLP